jgi:hypothetical protein
MATTSPRRVLDDELQPVAAGAEVAVGGQAYAALELLVVGMAHGRAGGSRFQPSLVATGGEGVPEGGVWTWRPTRRFRRSIMASIPQRR